MRIIFTLKYILIQKILLKQESLITIKLKFELI